ncbi:hypothetical protein GG804_24935 [Sphingomonas histidinilytica]|uniref:hypothetical protein n=1 Tax=Rhizorhabdus histidinilytica TaxID=439228 RepID=UPI001ADBC91C|nr:hypothetical protein [Rhizorhabdus histidinilytica]MBO9380017.1 hypothetical protein [Rhizorhabdus histidinilytica]
MAKHEHTPSRRSILAAIAVTPMIAVPAAASAAAIETTFSRWKAAYLASNSSHRGDQAILNIIDRSEQEIFDCAQLSPRVAEMHLWIILSYTTTDRNDVIAIGKEDAGYLYSVERDYDWPERLTVHAIKALRGGRA